MKFDLSTAFSCSDVRERCAYFPLALQLAIKKAIKPSRKANLDILFPPIEAAMPFSTGLDATGAARELLRALTRVDKVSRPGRRAFRRLVTHLAPYIFVFVV